MRHQGGVVGEVYYLHHILTVNRQYVLAVHFRQLVLCFVMVASFDWDEPFMELSEGGFFQTTGRFTF